VLLMLTRDDWRVEDRSQRYLLLAALFFLSLWALLNLVRWLVEHVELSNGWKFAFAGGYRDLLFWYCLLGISALTIVGWAWVLAAMYRWMAENTRAPRQALRFHGHGHQILWRTLAMGLFCVPIVTIPWSVLWYAQWLVGQVTIDGQLAAAA
jgi:hypothetical protein